MTIRRIFKLSLIGLLGLAAAACRPAYVRESHHEIYTSPAYAQPYGREPVFVERRTVYVPQLVVTSPRVVVRPPESMHHHREGVRWDERRRHRHGDRDDRDDRDHDAPQRRFGR